MTAKSAIPLVLKFADWPGEDQRLWQRCLARGRLFDNARGAFAAWSDGTRCLHMQGYGEWLSHIKRCRPDLVDAPPADRITPETVGAFVVEGQERLKPRSILDQLSSLATVVRGFAPEADFAWLWRAVNNFRTQSGPIQLKAPIALSARDLFKWSLDRLNALKAEDHPDQLRTATAFRQALTVGLLISCPVRARAFVAMTVSGHIDIAGGHIVLSFRPEDMKDRKSRRLPVPEPLAPFMFDYLEVYRPLLLDGRNSDALWISRRGNPLSQDSLTSGLALLTKRNFGIVLRPHAFRHIAATSIATSEPAHAGIIRDVLGHSTIRMAEAHYNRATAREASQRLQDILRSRRKVHRQSRRRQRREELDRCEDEG